MTANQAITPTSKITDDAGRDWTWAFIIFRPIPSHDGYIAGTDGSVWSCKNRHGTHTGRWHRIKTSRDRGGYIKVKFVESQRRHHYVVGRVILMTFVGSMPEGFEACHKNDDPADNRLSNLEWDSHSNNVKQRNDRNRQAKGTGHASARLTESDVIEIRRSMDAGESPRKLAKRYGIAHQNIRRVGLRLTWRHVPEAVHRR